jgi:hypothetical protein
MVSQTVLLTREQVSIGHTALMDWSSFFKLTEKSSVDLLRQKLTAPGDPMLLREALGPFLVDLIARLVVYDGLLLDTAAGQPFFNPLSSEAVRIAQVQFEPNIYQVAANTSFEYLRTVEEHRGKQATVSDNEALFYSDFKRYVDQISRGFPRIGGGGLADSNQGVPRAIFYLELSRQLGLQLFLSYEKRDLLKQLEKLIWKDAFSLVSTAVDAAIMKSQAIGAEYSDVRLQTPAVVDLVIGRAFDRKISLEQSIIEVRNLEGAQQFRDLLSRIQHLMMVGDKASTLEVNKILAPLLKAANTWSIAADPRVRWLWKAKIGKLPKIGEFLELFGLEVPAIPIKGHFRSYVQFVSEWYKTQVGDTSNVERDL